MGEREERGERGERADIDEREEREEREPDRYYISETDKQAKNGKKRISKASYSIYIGISRSARIKSAHKHIGY